MKKIWLVEDEATIADTLIYKLESEHYQVEWFERGELALQALEKQYPVIPNLMILDVGLPDITGFDLAGKIIPNYNIPIIFLTARSEEIDRIVGLEIGADDYIAKPFSPREVSARIKAIFRRIEKQKNITTAPENHVGDFSINIESAIIRYHGQVLQLTRYEYLLLKTFLLSPNRIFSRSQLMDIVWQDNLNTMERTVDTHIKTIRQKLSNVIADNQCGGIQPIKTYRGLGYSLTIL